MLDDGFKPTRGSAERRAVDGPQRQEAASNPRGVRLKDKDEVIAALRDQELQTHEGFG